MLSDNRLFLVPALALVPVSIASGGVTSVYEDRALWEGATDGPIMIEDFESESLGFLPQPATLESG